MFIIDVKKAKKNLEAKEVCNNCNGVYQHVNFCDKCPMNEQRKDNEKYITDITDYSGIPF